VGLAGDSRIHIHASLPHERERHCRMVHFLHSFWSARFIAGSWARACWSCCRPRPSAPAAMANGSS
jgi:hypothetical protein